MNDDRFTARTVNFGEIYKPSEAVLNSLLNNGVTPDQMEVAKKIIEANRNK